MEPGGRGCVGCGPQEQFYACADIAVGNHTLPDDVTLPYWREVYPDETTVGMVEYKTEYSQDYKDKMMKIKESMGVDLSDKYSEEYIRAKLLQLANYFFPGRKHNCAVIFTINFYILIFQVIFLNILSES